MNKDMMLEDYKDIWEEYLNFIDRFRELETQRLMFFLIGLNVKTALECAPSNEQAMELIEFSIKFGIDLYEKEKS